jgi:glycosyltransferase involved in cell wall biosynthesis
MAVNDPGAEYKYLSPVGFEIQQDTQTSYACAAEFLNASGVDLLCVEHEFGIFGGTSGAFLLGLVRRSKAPLVTALHTVPRLPDATQRHVLLDLFAISSRIVVHGRFGARFLSSVYGVPPEKIDCIPLGVPDITRKESSEVKAKLDLDGRIVLLTVGFLSPNKGIEDVITALPAIVAVKPRVLYVVAGTTHPVVRRREGESYLKRLIRMSESLHIKDHVVFWNRYLDTAELQEVLLAADIYISPYRNRDQISSGTLAWALAAGRAIITTPYWNALELLENDAGVFVPFRSPEAIAGAVIELLDDPAKHALCEQRAQLLSRPMLWEKIGSRYQACFERAMDNSSDTIAPHTDSPQQSDMLLKLDHLCRLTDDTGISQHAVLSIPNRREGYCTDDNARALVLSALLDSKNGQVPNTRRLESTYLAFLWHAFNPSSGRMRNFCTYDRRWVELVGSEECHGRALWGLGTAMSQSADVGIRDCARELFLSAVTAVKRFVSTRAWSYAILGIEAHFGSSYEIPEATNLYHLLAERLQSLYRSHATPEWPWFEEGLTYFNGVLPHALVAAGVSMKRNDMIEAGMTALDWLLRIQGWERECFSPIGNQGFYYRGKEKADFDQQPIEAKSMALACLRVYQTTGDTGWLRKAEWLFNWFLGGNQLGLTLYDSETGGCRDGLHAFGANQNQGAESTLSFLLTTVEFQRTKNSLKAGHYVL